MEKNKKISLKDVIDYSDAELIKSIQKGCGCEVDQANEMFNELKKFLYLSVSTHLMMSPSRIIDQARHVCLENEKNYSRMCKTLFGEHVYHLKDEKQKKPNMFAYNNVLRGYNNVFGKESRKFWPRSISSVALCISQCKKYKS